MLSLADVFHVCFMTSFLGRERGHVAYHMKLAKSAKPLRKKPSDLQILVVHCSTDGLLQALHGDCLCIAASSEGGLVEIGLSESGFRKMMENV